MAIVQPIDQGRWHQPSSHKEHLYKATKEASPGPAAKHVTPPDPRSLPTPTDFLQGDRSASMSMDQLWSALQHGNAASVPEMKQEHFATNAGRGRGYSPLNPSVQQFFAQHDHQQVMFNFFLDFTTVLYTLDGVLIFTHKSRILLNRKVS